MICYFLLYPIDWLNERDWVKSVFSVLQLASTISLGSVIGCQVFHLIPESSGRLFGAILVGFISFVLFGGLSYPGDKDSASPTCVDPGELYNLYDRVNWRIIRPNFAISLLISFYATALTIASPYYLSGLAIWSILVIMAFVAIPLASVISVSPE